MTGPSEQVAEWQRLAEEATPGPWEPHVLGSEGYDVRAQRPPTAGRLSRLRVARCGYEEWETDKANAAFIAAAREAVPALLADRAALAARLAEVEGEVEELWRGLGKAIRKAQRRKTQRDEARAAVGRAEALADELEAAEIADLRDHHAGDLRAALRGEAGEGRA